MAKSATAAKTKPVAKKAATKPAATKKPAAKSAASKKPAAGKAAVGKTVAKKSAVTKAAAKPAAASKPQTGKPAVKGAPKSVAKAAASSGKATAGKSATTAPKHPHAAATHLAGSHTGASKSEKMTKTATHRKPAVVDNDEGVTREDGRYALPATVQIDLPKGYKPKASEEYMSPRQLAYFRAKLRDWREQLVEESRQTMENLREEVRDVGDDAERATRETENSLELRTRDRYRKLISKIDGALRRIEDGRYGYCEETDEEIGVERLDARPIATLSLDAQERREHLRKQMGD
ncbi:MAG TPA: RNA polymerase-binding protein DksA [Rhodanobacteraceae bacterium]|nr:RNA polymerase-binding protein DksA [Rhodanobacteraceae bacterium]